MGVPAKSTVPYHDDPDAVSMHTTPGESSDYEPPTYSVGTDLAGSSGHAPPTYADATVEGPLSGIPGVGVYEPTPSRLPSGKPTGIDEANRRSTGWKSSTKVIGRSTSCVKETNTLQESRTDTEPEYLEEVIREMARQAPTPFIQIIGTHSERKHSNDSKSSSRSEQVTDFSILINMRNYLWSNFDPRATNSMDLRTVENGEKTHRGTTFATRAPGYQAEIEVGDARPDLREWCHRYCASPSSSRIFRLTRTVTNMDTELLKARIEGLVRSTNYRGKLEITFPIADRHVDIYTTTRIQTWRLTTWIRWLFYLTLLWLFTWPLLLFTTKRWAVVRAEWPFAILDARGQKIYTTVSEEDWVGKFGLAVRQLALDRFVGEAGDDHLTQVLSRPETTRDPRQQTDVGRAVGSAVNAWRGGLSAGSLMSLGSSNDQVGWGYDT